MKYWALALLLACSSASAEIGSVIDLTGTAVIKRGKETITVSKGTQVETNDKVETKNGTVNIKFKDNTNVKITENSALVIDDFVYDPKNSAGGKLNLKAAAGTVRYVSGNIAKDNPNSVKINTPTAAIAVRGTDFVMAVDEMGKSLIMLMPDCEQEQIINLKGITCSSGRIEVDTALGKVTLDQPYQATIVETASAAPLPPVIVNLSNMAINNNLLIRPIMTTHGMIIQTAARSAAERTGDAKKETEEAKANEEQRTSNQQRAVAQQQEQDRALSLLTQLKEQGVEVVGNMSENEHVVRMHKNDNPNLNQIGWGYMSLSPSGNNFTAVTLPTDTKALVVVTQDRLTDAFNFSGPYGRPQGTIVITQSYK